MSTFRISLLSFDALKKSNQIATYAIIWLVITVIELMHQTLMARLLTDMNGVNLPNKITIVALILSIPLLRYGIFGNQNTKISAEVNIQLWEQMLKEYSALTIDAKASFSCREMERKMKNVEWGFSYWIENGFPTILNIISMIYLCLYTFIKTKNINLFIILVLGNSALYFLVKRKLDKKMSDVWEDNHKKSEKITNKLSLNLPRFAYGQRSLDTVMKLVRDHCEIKSKFDKSRNEQKAFTGILNQICLAFVLLIVENQNLISLLTVTIQFTSMVNGIFNLINTNIHFEEQYNTLRKKLDSSKKQQSIIKHIPFDQEYTITKYQVNKKGFQLNMMTSLNMGIGKKYLIQGPSGAGKSTFLNGILGMDEDAEVVIDNGNTPKNYFKNISLMYQSIKEDIHLNSLTLREVFDDSDNEQLIEEVLAIACVGIWIDRLKQIAENPDETQVNIDQKKGNKKSWLDIELSEIGRISGGEKTRLIVSIQLFELVIHKKKILVFDEIEQGSDPPIAYKLIKNIIDKYSKSTLIVMISHLEKFGGHNGSPNTSGIVWDQIMFVDKGLVKIV